MNYYYNNLAYNLASSDKLQKQSFLFQVGKNITDTPALFYSNPIQVNETSNKFIIPVFNVVIKVKEGEITDVVWYENFFNFSKNKLGIMIALTASTGIAIQITIKLLFSILR